MKIYLFLLFFGGFLINSMADTYIPGGSVSGTWLVSGSPYFIEGDINIEAGDVLNIEAGVEVYFIGKLRLLVQGTLMAEGTENQPILFSRFNPGPEWKGIRFHNASSNSRMKYCIVEQSHATGDIPDNFGGGIYINSCSPVISYCTIRDNTASFGGGIYTVASSAEILYCTLNNNYVGGGGGGIYLLGGSTQVINCSIYGNHADAGGAVYAEMGAPLISNCIMENNDSYAVVCMDPITPTITYNNLINNEDGNYIGYLPPNIGFITGTNLNGDPCDDYFNIYEESMMIDPEGGDFHLSEGSKCIDAGDPNLLYDPDATIRDIGAYYYDQMIISVEENPNTLSNVSISPNPTPGSLMLKFSSKERRNIQIQLFDITGKNIASFMKLDCKKGIIQFSWDISEILTAKGTYILLITSGMHSRSSKFIYH